MDLTPAEELLDYQLALCPEKALWLETTKKNNNVSYTFLDIKPSDMRLLCQELNKTGKTDENTVT